MNAIFAVNSVDGFGLGDTMPWPRSSGDLSRFRLLTSGNTVVMGASTWLSNIPRPFPNRRNCVLSSTLVDDRCEVFPDITSLMMNIKEDERVWVIGGRHVLLGMRRYITMVYLTRFKSSQPATITLNTEEYLQGFTQTSSQDFGDHVFDIYTREL
jgi:dihydrofolate reductase